MEADPELLKALARGVEQDPSSLPLRLHLAALLLANGDAALSATHYAEALTREPANLTALEGAAGAADAQGDPARAEAYRRLAAGLADVVQSPADTPTQPPAPEVPARKLTKRLNVINAEEELFEEVWVPERPTLRLDDVGGMDDVKHRLTVSFLAPMRNPEVLQAYGKSLRGGLLLYGPPGCGKTLLARAIAGEMDAHFISVALSDVLDMWLGESEKHLHQVFEAARRNAPCVVFVDEVDAIGQRRTNLKHHPSLRNVVNQFLAELDGVDSDNEGVFLLGASNHPWDIDSAFLRPGRFDRLMLVLPPDLPARIAILRGAMRGRPVGEVDYEALGRRIEGFSGADAVHLCETATEAAIEEALASGSTRPITSAHFERALSEVKASTGPWFETARNFVTFGNDSGVYDELLKYMRQRKLL